MATLISLIIFTFLLFITPYSLGDTITVTNLRDSGPGSLRRAIMDSNATPGVDDEIVFSDNITGVIPTDAMIFNTFTGEMEITDDVRIIGPGNDLIIIDGQMLHRILSINSGTDIAVTISGLKFIGGDSSLDGGAIFNTEDLTINSCVFEDNAARRGGAIFNTAELTVRSTIFDSNSAPQDGPLSGSGGAIYNGSTASITRSRFDGNTAFIQGGAIFNSSSATIEEITRTTFVNNESDINGAAIYSEGTINFIVRSTFDNNAADGNTGGIYNAGGDIELITLCTFNDNFSDESGGAIFNDSDSTIGEILFCTFSSNTNDDGDGPAIFNKGTIDTIALSAFTGNSTGDGNGGAVGNEGVITDLSLCTFSGNIASLATGTGGAIANTGTINISFVTIANNQAIQGGGGLFNGLLATMNIKNSILANNTVDNCDASLGFTASGINLSTDATCPGFIEVTSNAVNLDPSGPQDNGGTTQTIALISPSVAIDAIELEDCTDHQEVPAPVNQDQREVSRPQGSKCDVGAFELEARFIITDIPTLSEWGLIAMAGVLGIVGFMVIRRRKLTT